MKKHNGPHKYKRVRAKTGTILWRCMLPGCPHYIRDEFIEGQESLCWRCDQVMVIERVTKHLKPHHRECVKSRKPVLVEHGPIEPSPI